MNQKLSMKLGLERCLSCEHRWIDYEGVRGTCYSCGSTEISECVSLKEIREAISALRKEDKKYLDKHAKRTVILKQLYHEIAELSLKRAQDIYGKIKPLYAKGDLSDRVIDQLIVSFRLFSDLGVYKSAGAIAYMISTGYAQRGIAKEVRTIDDLSDLVAARQWFMRLGSKEWEAAVNLHIGQKAMAVVNDDHAMLQSIAQVSVWHFYKARDYYFEQRQTKMVERIQFDIERATQLLTSYAQGAAHVEAAKIAARSTIQHGADIRKGLESLGQHVNHGLMALGEHIEEFGGSVNRALKASSAALSANVTHAMYTLSSGSRFRGKSLDKRMSDVGQLIAATAREVPEGFFQPVKQLGAKFALSAVSGAATTDITGEPQIQKMAEEVLPEGKKTEESMKRMKDPSLKVTGTMLDTFVSKGMTKASEQLHEIETGKER